MATEATIERVLPGGRGAAAFVDFFARGWHSPKPDGFLEHFRASLHPDLRMVQPLMAPIDGIDGFEREFRLTFRALPDLRADVDDWAESDGGAIYIWFRLTATVGRRKLSWQACDRFRFRDGLVVERVSLFDALPLVPATLASPRLWLLAARSAAGRVLNR